ncbi:hypothetical protein [Chlamydia trachomatis]|uniref:Candidate inclusion membrane protein n=1 Tax=Chlamydia trachomatis TaxID=813 RepID=K0G9Z2_CHLTH|nr:hypothetical protein [Chlamydia trachomatis]ADH16956.1 hypothetical protein E150_01000 [Chlamydia trachomatis E/150]ADH20651.1 hypothetical protein E11023_00990 [Chlamydia trachomatis E/11023]AFU24117.1 hypothetical protein CT192 [Chlamydia trachomatis]AGR99165.1 hypothetical protein CTRC342_01025 [Chlamydia trachomatis RC-F(s)/342]AGT64173.1 putative inclusion membrane protein [Chlamydia trachomatis]
MFFSGLVETLPPSTCLISKKTRKEEFVQSVGQEASQNTLSWTIRPRIPSIVQGSKEVSLALFVLGTVLAIGGAFSVCLGALFLGGVVLATGLLLAVLEFCHIRSSMEKYVILTKQDLFKEPVIQEEQATPLIEEASYICEPGIPLSGLEEVQQERPVILQKDLDLSHAPKYIAVGSHVVELVKAGKIGRNGERLLEEGIDTDQNFVRVWDELFILGQRGEVVRLDGFCCKVLPKTSKSESINDLVSNDC